MSRYKFYFCSFMYFDLLISCIKFYEKMKNGLSCYKIFELSILVFLAIWSSPWMKTTVDIFFINVYILFSDELFELRLKMELWIEFSINSFFLNYFMYLTSIIAMICLKGWKMRKTMMIRLIHWSVNELILKKMKRVNSTIVIQLENYPMYPQYSKTGV